MSDFKVIETQEQFDAAIGDRLKRERDTVKKEYEGYLSPEAAEQKFAGYLSPEKEAEKYKGYLSPEEVAKKDEKIKRYESHSVKTRIAHELGLSYDSVDFLKGEDEDSIRKSAEALKALVGAGNQAPPLADTEGRIKDEDAALRQTLKNLRKGD